jgi:UDP-N-acetylmuramyl pentapeptide phosphotransferase/UDP-N-acetylglucosamine-1-phosphate transferase
MIVRDLATFVAAFVGSAALTPLARRVAIRTGIVDHPAPHKFHQRTTPYLGGLAITAPFLLVLVLVYSWEGVHGSIAAGAAAVFLPLVNGYGVYGLRVVSQRSRGRRRSAYRTGGGPAGRRGRTQRGQWRHRES